MNHASTSLPQSSLFLIWGTSSAGRSIFASKDIPAGTLIYETSQIGAQVILRPYKKEVCSRCFAYEQGRNLPIRPAGLGLVFCTEACRIAFSAHVGSHGVIAFEAVEALLQRQKQSVGDIEMGEDPTRPSAEDIVKAWAEAEPYAAGIRAARLHDHPTKQESRTLRDALALTQTSYVILYPLSGLLYLYANGDTDMQSEREAALMQLEASDTPYFSQSDLMAHITAYYQLLALLPTELLSHITAKRIQEIASRTAHNAFDIRSIDHTIQPNVTVGEARGNPEDVTEAPGSEVLGMGIWPLASYFNHSCAPNVRKQRVGKTWQFWATRDVQAKEELNITYMGGDEKEFDVGQRRERLQDGWGFSCACTRCVLESES